MRCQPGFRYDLVGVTRQVLANHANALQQQCAIVFTNPAGNSFSPKHRHRCKPANRSLTAFDQQMRDWEWNWVNNSRELYPTTPTGSSVEVAKALYKQYRPVVAK